MGFFDHIQKKGQTALKPQTSAVRKEVVTADALPSKREHSTPLSRNHIVPRLRHTVKQKSRTLKPAISRPLNPRKRASPAQQIFDNSSDSSTDETASDISRKRVKTSSGTEPDLKRQIRCREPFLDKNNEGSSMVHAAHIASLKSSGKYFAAFPESSGTTELFLQYPLALLREKYNLVIPRDKDDFKPLEDICEVIEIISANYLPMDEAATLLDERTGILRRLKRALRDRLELEFRSVIHEWNEVMTKLRRDGTIGTILDGMPHLDLHLIERILTQTYSRTVSPRINLLRQYENGTDNVYGELLPRFISKIFKDTNITSDQLFVDLGSGVGNVVLQAALEIGCESWGCEMMENACDLAELQEKEFNVRCRLWGIAAGKLHLERGDFLQNVAIGKILPKADVVLVNNQAFTPGLNDGLINLFLDLKEGCQIVSLKSFVPHGHKIASRNLNSPINLLDVEKKRYFSNSVSWTDAEGTYFVARKDSSKLKSFTENRG